MGRGIKEGAQIVMIEYMKWFIRTCTIVGIPCTLFLIAYIAKLGALQAGCALYEGWCQQYEEISPDDVLEALSADPKTYDKVTKKR